MDGTLKDCGDGQASGKCETFLGAETAMPRQPQTVGEMLDARIQRTRKNVEELCILKAKAEAANILDFPSDFINALAWS